MAITGIRNYDNNSICENNCTSKSNVTTSTVELKTSNGGTKTEQINTGYSNVNDYSKYLQSEYSYMNTGTTSMNGVPTTVSVSSAFLKKCMNDPEKAKYLEENLAVLPDCVSYAKSHTLGTVTSISYEIDANGNITGIMSGTNDPDGKIMRENVKKKIAEKKTAEEKAAKKRAEKGTEEKKITEQQSKKKEIKKTGEYTINITATNIKSVTQKVIAASTSMLKGENFNIKA